MTKELTCGAGKTEISHGWGGPLAGYAARTGAAVGVHDPLFARMALFDGGSRQFGLVVLDLLKVDHNLVTRINRAINAVTGISPQAITVAATHTHAAPSSLFAGYDSFNPELVTVLVQRITKLAEKVWAGRVPARLGWQNGALHELGRNRNTHVTAFDPSVGVLRVDRLDGQTLALIFNFACHPTVLSESNLLISRDFPGYAVDGVEQKISGGSSVAIFVNGAAGDISTRYTRRASTFAEAERLGGLLAARVWEINRDLHTSAAWELDTKYTTVTLPRRRLSLESVRKILQDARQELDDIQIRPGVSPGELRTAQTMVQAVEIRLTKLLKNDLALKEARQQPPITAEFTVVSFAGNSQAVLVVLPGESVTAIGKRIKETIHKLTGIETGQIWVIGYGNGHIGYLCPTETDLKTDYETIMSEIDAGATEAIITAISDLVLKGS